MKPLNNSSHPDYLGNTEFITDITGRPYQHFFYSPFGEELVSQHAGNGNYDSPYRFNAKEVDPETGYYYYGERYYNSNLSIWLSVDPLADQYPEWSPYNFVMNNPVMLVDPDGREPTLARTTGVSALMSDLRSAGVNSLSGLIAHYGGMHLATSASMVSGEANLNGRYLYSPSAGWLDMKHFAAAAKATDKWYATGNMVLREGEKTERQQELNGSNSAWSYEDLPSNMYGVEFEEYLENNNGEFLDVLESYLVEKGFVDNPLKIAPNASQMPSTDPVGPPTATNHTYTPMYTLTPKISLPDFTLDCNHGGAIQDSTNPSNVSPWLFQ